MQDTKKRLVPAKLIWHPITTTIRINKWKSRVSAVLGSEIRGGVVAKLEGISTKIRVKIAPIFVNNDTIFVFDSPANFLFVEYIRDLIFVTNTNIFVEYYIRQFVDQD